MASASLAPLVKISAPGQSSASQMAVRASSSARRAARPSACGLEGLAPSASPSISAARAAGEIGALAAWSR